MEIRAVTCLLDFGSAFKTIWTLALSTVPLATIPLLGSLSLWYSSGDASDGHRALVRNSSPAQELYSIFLPIKKKQKHSKVSRHFERRPCCAQRVRTEPGCRKCLAPWNPLFAAHNCAHLEENRAAFRFPFLGTQPILKYHRKQLLSHVGPALPPSLVFQKKQNFST